MQEAVLGAFVESSMDDLSLLMVLQHLGAQHMMLLFQYLLSWLRQHSGQLLQDMNLTNNLVIN